MAKLINEILVGVDGKVPHLNNMTMYRQISLDNAFVPQYRISDDCEELLPSSQVVIFYKEYVKNDMNEIVNELTKQKRYIIKDEEVWKPVLALFTGTSRTPVTMTKGILDQIETALKWIPKDAPDQYLLKFSDFPTE